MNAIRLTDKHVHELKLAQIGKCTCLTKTPDTKFHAEDCRYRLLSEVTEVIETLMRAQHAAQQSEFKVFASLLLSAAAQSGDENTIKLAMQLAGCAPCEKCGYVNFHCKCPTAAVES